MSKTVGIVIDNYKERTFKRQLSNKGYKFTIHPFTESTKTIKVVINDEGVDKLHRVVTSIESMIKNKN